MSGGARRVLAIQPIQMPDENRRLVHTRSIQVEAYARPDGLWDLVAGIRDVKPRDLQLETHVVPAGADLHRMELTVTIDKRLNIVAAQARTLAGPYMGECDSFAQVYQQLVGLNLLAGFRAAVRERLGGDKACTHITELAGALPTAAVQAFAGEVYHLRPDSATQPPQLGRCRALRVDGPVVAKLYPRWARTDKNEGGEA
jgi:hypothetical protein